MPITPTYPGVYIEEIPSGVHTITGVATSITAFVGRAARGPLNAPTTVYSFAEYERKFGGLALFSTMSYAVHDFFLNGGGQALIVRIIHPNFASDALGDQANAAALDILADVNAAADVASAKTAADAKRTSYDADTTKSAEQKVVVDAIAVAVDAAAALTGATLDSVKSAAASSAAKVVPLAATITLTGSTTGQDLSLQAVSPGSWGNALRARIDYNNLSNDVAMRYGPAFIAADLFNLTVRDMSTGATEQFLNLMVADTPRRVDRVLQSQSSQVYLSGNVPTARPKASDEGLSVTDKAKQIFKDSNDPRSKGVNALMDDGGDLGADDCSGAGLADNKRGLYALDKADLFNLLCIPPPTTDGDTDKQVYSDAMIYCANHRAMLIVDPPTAWNNEVLLQDPANKLGSDLGLTGVESRNAALYYPRVVEPNPLHDHQLETFVPCGLIAGAYARIDAQRGVWKAPAGIDVGLNGVLDLEAKLTDMENGALNQLGINCLRSFPVTGKVVWGARTLRGADQLADDYKYVPVRRLALFLEESLYRGTQWVVFEPNDEPLWAQIRLNVGAFMHNLFRQGAFQGKSPREAYFVKCDHETTTQNDINLGIVNVVVGFAPLKPAEFVIIQIQQMAGQIEV